MLVSEAAKRLGMNTQTLRLALQQRVFPFGAAVKTSQNRFVYYINTERLNKYLRGEDMNEAKVFSNDHLINGCSDNARIHNYE